VTDLKPPGNSTAQNHKSPFILDEWLKRSMEKREEILTKRRMELGRPSNDSSQHRLPTRTVHAHDAHKDDLIEYSTNSYDH
jgi:hypothetical protein